MLLGSSEILHGQVEPREPPPLPPSPRHVRRVTPRTTAVAPKRQHKPPREEKAHRPPPPAPSLPPAEALPPPEDMPSHRRPPASGGGLSAHVTILVEMAYDERNGSTGGFSKRKPKKEATVSLQHDTNKYEEGGRTGAFSRFDA